MAKKRSFAVLVGCNYPKTKYELRGCVNDVVAMRETLERRFGFERSRIELLTDELGSKSPKPTGENIKRALGEMVDKAEPGDVLYFHYSGHGTRIPSLKPNNPFRKDEAIVPCDFNLITDVDFRHLVNRVPQGASFTILSDSCHSGGLIDKEKEQIGPREISPTNLTTTEMTRARNISAESLLDHLSSLTNISSTAGVATHMLELFGSKASLAFTGVLEGGPAQFLKAKAADEGILLSGCQADETSADVGEGGKARGAFSSAVERVLSVAAAESSNDYGKGGLSNREVVVRARRILREKGFMTQHPCLYCTDRNADAIFLSHPST